MCRSAHIALILLVALLVPAHVAFAADTPDVINDPPAAFDDDSTSATIDLDEQPSEVAAESATGSENHGSASLRVDRAAFATSTPSGELPFTGPNADVIAAVLLGVVLISAGVALRAVPKPQHA